MLKDKVELMAQVLKEFPTQDRYDGGNTPQDAFTQMLFEVAYEDFLQNVYKEQYDAHEDYPTTAYEEAQNYADNMWKGDTPQEQLSYWIKQPTVTDFLLLQENV